MANWDSQPSGVRARGGAMTPALRTRASSGPSHPATRRAIEPESARSSGSTVTAAPVARSIEAAASIPSSWDRLVIVTRAPAAASACAVARPMPEEPPVTSIARPERSTPSSTSAAVVRSPNGVTRRSAPAAGALTPRASR